MRSKGLAHEALSLLFKRDGVPNTIITDGSKEHVQGEFKRKCKEAGCHMRWTEPYSPWQNNAELCTVIGKSSTLKLELGILRFEEVAKLEFIFLRKTKD